MRIAIVSDIHANLPALESVINDIRTNFNDVVLKINLGDIVGYGPYPNECVDISKNFFDINLMGNHDYAASGLMDYHFFNQYAKEAIEFTINTLDKNNIKFLSSLPFTHKINNLFFVHSSPIFPDNWSYIINKDEAKMVFYTNSEYKIIFVGHSHIPIVFIQKGNSIVSKYGEKIKINDDEEAIVNVGSVGQPRDGDNRACYVIYDTEKSEILYRRLSYDLNKEVQAMKKRGLPEFLINRLFKGK